MQLVIVESPTKAKTLGKFLGNNYRVIASMGHVRDLPEDRLGIDVNHDFAPQYTTLVDHKKIVAELKEAAEKSESVILATDPDREGEAIAWHIGYILGKNSKFKFQSSKIKSSASAKSDLATADKQKLIRVTFHEITKSAVDEALANPHEINIPLVDAQQARRILDRLVGYKLSPLLWSKVRKGLSAGRVQSVTLRIIVEREREIEKFKAEEYWTINLNAKCQIVNDKLNKDKIIFELISKDGIKYETSQSYDLYDGQYTVSKTSITSKDQADLIIKDIDNHSIIISDIEKKLVKRSPLPPFTTSTLQQEAGRKLGFSSKKTMQIAQRLYENGHITYHRTDSVNLAIEAVNQCRKFIVSEFGQEYLPEKPRFFKMKQKLAQEAHEAIRPTKIEVGSGKSEMGEAKNNFELGRDEERLYQLIWKRFIACQMREAEMERTGVTAVTVNGQWSMVDSRLGIENAKDQRPTTKDQQTNDHRPTTNDYFFKANGSVIVFPGFLKVYPEALEENRLPVLEKGQVLEKEALIPIQHFTMPPPRYSEASLIQTLEEKGIGRPSTYAPTLSNILDRHYVEKEEKKLKPTSLGIAVNDFLVVNFADIDDIPFTAGMEDELDEIASGNKQWLPVIRDFFTPFSKTIQGVYKTGERVKIEVEESNEICDKCGSPMVVRIGRFGKFLACSKFPECKTTKSLTIKIDIKCPEDAGDVIIKRTKRGKTFYGCSNYPNCKWASWTKPK